MSEPLEREAAAAEAAGAGMPGRELREITDARTMRALAHPTRLALLDLLRRDGEITATRAAEALGESPGNMSWHLQTLAKYGFVEESGTARGRSRPWRIAAVRSRFRASSENPEAVAAGDALVLQMIERSAEQHREWLSVHHSYPIEWQDTSFLSNSLTYLTPDELNQLSNDVAELFARHADRVQKRNRPAGALPVRLTAFGHQLPPTESGN